MMMMIMLMITMMVMMVTMTMITMMMMMWSPDVLHSQPIGSEFCESDIERQGGAEIEQVQYSITDNYQRCQSAL